MEQHATPSAAILESWVANAGPWADSVREGRIESRRVATDGAIVDAVRALAPRRLLDVGCGEGWLCRALAAAGIEVTGIDGAPALVDAARRAGGGRFELCRYDALATDALAFGRFDAAVCNFSLFDEHVGPLLAALRALLAPRGAALIQTVHPEAIAGGDREGWREETFASLGDGYTTSMPWYLRTEAGWRRSLLAAGFAAVDAAPVRHPGSGAPLSLMLRAAAQR